MTRFCQSADRALAPRHVPVLRKFGTPDERAQLADTTMPFAGKARTDLRNPEEGVVRFEHDHYLKMSPLTEPKVKDDFLLLDEAQNANPVLEQVFRRSARPRTVGDGRGSAQAICGWRGVRAA
ncbi:hypothetical protein [Streptomyces sp. NPDC050759]|uniref:hypothetical protein n=1 Tax=Streptomyces sp. NPDC050759 TaxID=3365635 RepID=UPI0037A0A922